MNEVEREQADSKLDSTPLRHESVRSMHACSAFSKNPIAQRQDKTLRVGKTKLITFCIRSRYAASAGEEWLREESENMCRMDSPNEIMVLGFVAQRLATVSRRGISRALKL